MKRILNYVGSKWNMAKWIIQQMPEHNVYLEPFFGSGAVLFNKPAVGIETVNDIDGNIVNLFKVIRENPTELAQAVEFTPYSREEYYLSFDLLKQELSDVERARIFLIRCWMARGGKTSDRTGWRHNIDIATVNALPDWNTLPGTILEATKRLKEVQIENQDAITLVERYNREDCLIYADPPYVLSTRTKRHYAHEMNNEQHIQLLKSLKEHKGYVLLSGYDSDLYNEILDGWTQLTKMVQTEAAQSKQEVLWINPAAIKKNDQLNIFDVVNSL
ncbi:DNA adenine methylase [Ornithinibacillus xuwenensis]|uniref:site-specific DNA-methyltransferase (adenine-specific) n=1 Tax=Ornithinibacillus xuwenensis TaxID=3144668 RepID=A0ABU9XBW8_9BACI